MCIMCTEQMKKLTIREKLRGMNEMLETQPKDKEHLEEVHANLLREYADEICKEVMERTK